MCPTWIGTHVITFNYLYFLKLLPVSMYQVKVVSGAHVCVNFSRYVAKVNFIVIKSEVKYAGLQPIRLSGEDNLDQNHQKKDSMMDTEVDPVQQTNRSNHHEEEACSNYNRRDPMEILEHVKIDDALQSPISTVKNVFTDSNDNNELSFNKEELRKVEKQLRLVFVEFYQKLLHLKDYR